jgi:heat-inducible transcriptional repressor
LLFSLNLATSMGMNAKVTQARGDAEGGLSPLQDLDDRARDIFRRIVETYLETGEPVGSRFLARSGLDLSPASIRNTMADLAELGLLQSPHVSAGRYPTEKGLRLFVDAMLEFGALSADERRQLESDLAVSDESLDSVLERASGVLSGLTQAAGLVTAPTRDAIIQHVEFVQISQEQILVVVVDGAGQVENRVFTAPPGITPSALAAAGNYLNARLRGRTLPEARRAIKTELSEQRAELDVLASRLAEEGIAHWNPEEPRGGTLIVRGRSRLLEDTSLQEDLDRIRLLFDDLEKKTDLLQLLDLAKEARGVRVFIGSENRLFSLSGSAVVTAPYMDEQQNVVGVLGVIGPTRLNYARVIPLVDQTAKIVGRLVSGNTTQGTHNS